MEFGLVLDSQSLGLLNNKLKSMEKIYKLFEDRTWDKENNGKVEFKFSGTENECFEWIHKNTPYSFDLAIKEGGYKLIEVK